MCCRYSCFGGGAFGAALAPLMRSLTDGWCRYTGPRPSQPWCAALPACTVACLSSQSLSFPLPICNLFRISSLFALSVYPLASVSHLHLFHSPSRCAILHVLIRCLSFSRCAPDRGRRSRGVLHCLHASSHASHLHLFRSLSRSVISSV